MFERDYSAGQARMMSNETFIPTAGYRRDRPHEATGGVIGPRTHYASRQDVEAMARLVGARKKPTGRKVAGRPTKPVEAFIDGEWVWFDSAKYAATVLLVSADGIYRVCCGVRNKAGGYVWRWAQ